MAHYIYILFANDVGSLIAHSQTHISEDGSEGLSANG